jgi:hypothetical protein
MASMLLHDPWVHVFVLYAGALVIAFICDSRWAPKTDARRIDGTRPPNLERAA